jgi:predicted RNA-binding Zn-ribbon protein involved in translation (DUF1610 family)
MYKCKSCGSMIKKEEKCMGYCPTCGRDSLEEIDIVTCPICRKELGEAIWIDLQSIGWICTNHTGFQIRIVKEYFGSAEK